MNKFIRYGLASTLALALLSTSVAFAKDKEHDSDNNNEVQHVSTNNINVKFGEFLNFFNNHKPAARPIPVQMKLEIGPRGNANIEGTVASVSGNTFGVTTWGGTWTIVTDTNTHFSHHDSVSTLQVGDVVQIQGQVTASSTMTITARNVNDRSSDHRFGTGTGTTTPVLPVTGSALLPTAFVQSTNSGSSTLTVLASGTLYTINIGSSTQIFNHLVQPISLSSIQVNHTLAIYGATTSTTTINASVIQDLSL